MPANFNALLRYKTIEECLKNPYNPCTIDRMIEMCSDTLAEVKNRKKQISERTIREDLKVMRGGDLGFWAPIEQEDGVYYYADKDYSIFKQPINEIGLLREILFTLLEKRGDEADAEIDKLLMRIADVTGDVLDLQAVKPAEALRLSNRMTQYARYSMAVDEDVSLQIPSDEFNKKKKTDLPKKSIRARLSAAFNRIVDKHRKISKAKKEEGLFSWGEILKAI